MVTDYGIKKYFKEKYFLTCTRNSFFKIKKINAAV